MAASSGENISTKDLSKLPALSFTFVEDIIKGHGTSSGKEQMAKGFKYYSEEYVHSIFVDVSIYACIFICIFCLQIGIYLRILHILVV